MCGDFNTRVGSKAPHFDDTCLGRTSRDPRVCSRAPWLLGLCNLHHLHILNGSSPGPPAQFTYTGLWGSSVVDYILSTEGTLPVAHHPADTLGDTNHALLLTHFPVRTLPTPAARPQPQRTLYKWVQGTSTQD